MLPTAFTVQVLFQWRSHPLDKCLEHGNFTKTVEDVVSVSETEKRQSMFISQPISLTQ